MLGEGRHPPLLRRRGAGHGRVHHHGAAHVRLHPVRVGVGEAVDHLDRAEDGGRHLDGDVLLVLHLEPQPLAGRRLRLGHSGVLIAEDCEPGLLRLKEEIKWIETRTKPFLKVRDLHVMCLFQVSVSCIVQIIEWRKYGKEL